MSRLDIYSENKKLKTIETPQNIAKELSQHNVIFSQWTANSKLGQDATQEQIIAAYQPFVDDLMKKSGFQSADVVSLNNDHAKKSEFREKFLNEHIHSDDEVRFFVDGSGLFYLHFGDTVYGLLCQKGDLISIPANTKHWFDMGANPEFKCIRLFTDPAGWIAQFTGTAISSKYPKHA